MDLSIASILLLDGVTNGAIYALLAMAIVLLFAVTRVIFIPQGEYVAFGALTVGLFQAGQVPGTVWFLLGMAGGGIPSWLQPTGDETNDGSNDRVVDLIELGVFEALTRALVSSPAALADLGRLVDRLRTTEAGRRTLPEGFGELWEAVSAARSLIGATGQ